MFENKVLRKIFGAKRDEVTGEWRKLHNAELHALYSSPGIIRNIKSRSLRCVGHVARMGESRNAYKVLVGRPQGERPLGRPRRKWKDNFKMDLREMGYDDRDWINLAQDMDRWRAYVRAAMNLRSWIGRAIAQWPPRSPDLTSCDFYLCNFVKDKVYVPLLPNDLDELKQRITRIGESVDSFIHSFIHLVFCPRAGAQWYLGTYTYDCPEIETSAHVLGFCEQGLLLSNSRHHLIRSKIAVALRNKGWIVEEKISCLAEIVSTRRVDILAYNADTKQGIIVDPTIRFDLGCHQSAEVHHEKKSIYETTVNYFKLKYALIYVEFCQLGIFTLKRNSQEGF
ncbi:hypothetical protein ANN_00593 [Periplaneta americana]|uniref:Uncharacterized protein n=1 Tax=Periplaneta americana TaxID=6978 RepID=A0ABQ8TSX3_PERAM|nr:hypothetical protein ANN_00593 [Periplaneta americana]